MNDEKYLSLSGEGDLGLRVLSNGDLGGELHLLSERSYISSLLSDSFCSSIESTFCIVNKGDN